MRIVGAERDLPVPGQRKDTTMSRHHTLREHRPPILAATALSSVLLMCLGAGAAARASEPHVPITVFAGHYVLAGHVIDDLDVLERDVGTLRSRTVRLDACGSAADRAQRAAAHRFRAANLELRLLVPDAPGCRAAGPRAVPTSARHGQRPFGIDDATVDRWWHEQMP
jgi:hypothetical protein